MASIGLAALLLVLIVASLMLQSLWFSNFLRAKVVSTLEESTGGKVDIGSFQFDLSHLKVTIRNLVLHGTEPSDATPLVSVAELELRLKLFAGLHDAIDLAYLGVTEPRVNVVVNADGSTNIPSPKVKSNPDAKSPLATVVDLAIGQFRVTQGTLSYSKKTVPLDMRGENLRVLLHYNALNQSYQGNIDIAPFLISTANNANLPVKVKLAADDYSRGYEVDRCAFGYRPFES